MANVTHPIYEIYDESYLNNIKEEESIINYEKKNNDDFSWIPRKDFSPTDPNIHFLYFALEIQTQPLLVHFLHNIFYKYT